MLESQRPLLRNPTRDDVARVYIQALKAYVGKVHESEGKNRSELIDRWNHRAHCPVGSPYCLAGATAILDDVCKAEGWVNPVGVQAGTQNFFAHAPTAYRLKEPNPGAFAIFQSRSHPAHGHCAPVTSSLDPSKQFFHTTELNTDSAGSRDGDGCYEKVRSIEGSQTLVLKGFVDVAKWVSDFNSLHQSNSLHGRI